MIRFSLMTAMVAILGLDARAEDPVPTVPQKEHQWLKQLEGEWESDCESIHEPGQPPMKSQFTETVRSLGGLWYVAEMKSDFMGQSFTGLMSVGYDTQKKKFIGSWICSMCDWMCQYDGQLEGNVLTLNTEAPNPGTGKLVKMRDIIEIKNPDLRTLTSQMLGEDGKWVTFMTMTTKRKK